VANSKTKGRKHGSVIKGEKRRNTKALIKRKLTLRDEGLRSKED